MNPHIKIERYPGECELLFYTDSHIILDIENVTEEEVGQLLGGN